MRFFTICAKNYLAHAIALGEQLNTHHPEAAFTIFLADKTIGIDPDLVPFEIVTLEEVGLVAEREMIVRYNITELCTAIKPYCFLYLFNESESPVVYLDPDIFVVSALIEVEAALEAYDAVLTPHIVRPQELGELRSSTFLRYGIYNLGFLALRWSEQSESFLVWWAERLEAQGGIDIENGIFVDQKWADFIPAFIEKSLVLRHAGYNVAYWNLHNRTIEQKNETYFANGVPVRFVHFSAIPDASDPSISKRYPAFTVDSCPGVGELLSRYRRLLSESGLEQFQNLAFGYLLQPTEETNIHFPELASPVEQEEIFTRKATNYLLNRSIKSKAEYKRVLVETGDIESHRRSVESGLLRSFDQDGRIEFNGFDALQGEETVFYLGSTAAEPDQRAICAPWDFIVGNSPTSTRLRSLLHLFGQELQPKRDQAIGVLDADGDCESWLRGRDISFQSLRHMVHEHSEAAVEPASLDFVVVHPGAEWGPFEVLTRDIFELLKPGGHIMIGSQTGALDRLEGLAVTGYQNPQALCFWSQKFGYLGAARMVVTAQRPINRRSVKFGPKGSS